MKFTRLQHVLIWMGVIVMILIADSGIGVIMGWKLTLKNIPRNNTAAAKSSASTSTLPLVQCTQCTNIESPGANLLYRNGPAIVSVGQKTIKSDARNPVDTDSSRYSLTLNGAVSP